MPYRVENIVRKGKIAYYKQFLSFSQCFLQLYIFSASLVCGKGQTKAWCILETTGHKKLSISIIFYCFQYEAIKHFVQKVRCLSNAMWKGGLILANIKSFGVCKIETKHLQRAIWPFPKHALGFTYLQYNYFENTVGKGEFGRYE